MNEIDSEDLGAGCGREPGVPVSSSRSGGSIATDDTRPSQSIHQAS